MLFVPSLQEGNIYQYSGTALYVQTVNLNLKNKNDGEYNLEIAQLQRAAVLQIF